MHFDITYNEITYKVKILTIKNELNFLLYYSDAPINDLFNELVVSTPKMENFSKWEQLYILLLVRINSVGGQVTYQSACPDCKKVNEHSIDLEQDTDFDVEEHIYEFDNLKIKIKLGEITECVFNGNVVPIDVGIDSLILKDSIVINKALSKKVLESKKVNQCMFCQAKMVYTIDLENEMTSLISDKDISSLYKNMADLVYDANVPINDFKSLTIFEADLFINMINAKIEKENKE